ncbi:MAG: small multi-drug export protein [Kiritimatiellae bacterium]|nr:small multi-drug export protein [Kiritimatiellia bacterium]
MIVGAISTLPIVELRGAIPVGIGFLQMPWWEAFAVSVAGNMLPVPFILWFLGPLSRWGMRFRLGRRFFEWLFARTRRKTAGVEKYETLGLAIFVAIPLPMTGAWTGAMAAFVMGLSLRHALWSILLGVLVAGAIMTVLAKLGWIGATIFGLALLATMAGGLLQWLKRETPASGADQPGA